MSNPLSSINSNKKLLSWRGAFAVSIIFIAATFLLFSGYDFVLFLFFSPPGWIALAALLISPFFIIYELGKQRNLNLAYVMLIPGVLLVVWSGVQLGDEVNFGFKPYLLSEYLISMGLPLLLAFLIVLGSIKHKILSWKIAILVYGLAFAASFYVGLNVR